MEISPTTRPDTVPTGTGTDWDLTQLAALDLDNPALKRAIASVMDTDGNTISAFQSAVS